jgi:hypothetical protein
LVPLPHHDELVFAEQRNRDRGALPGYGVLDDHPTHYRNAAPSTALDREPLRRKLDDIGSIRPGMEPALELGKHENPRRGPVGPIDLRDQRERSLGLEEPLCKFEAGVLQRLR